MLKALGLLLIIAVCTAAGFFFSAGLKEKKRRLFFICEFLGEVSRGIRLGKELLQIVEESGERAGILLKGKSVVIVEDHLSKADKNALCELFSRLGMGDRASEAERCDSFLQVFREKEQAADELYKKGAALYGKLGLLSGLFVAVLLI